VAAALQVCCATPAFATSEQQSLEELRDTVINLLQALVDQGIITRQKAEQLVKQAKNKAAATATAQAKEEAGAVRVPYVPEIVKKEISKEVAAEVRPEVKADVVEEARKEGWGVPAALPDWLGHVRVTGDLTIRGQADLYGKGNGLGCPPGTLYNNCTILDYQTINTDGGVLKAGTAAFLNITQDRFRERARARLGVLADLSDSWDAGIRLASGALDDPGSEAPTLGEEFGRYTVGFDEIFLRWTGRTQDRFPYLTVSTGRFLNPFFSPTELVWQRDLAVDGGALTGRLGFGSGTGPDRSNVFVTLGGFPVQEIPLVAKDNKWLVGAQLGTTLHFAGDQRLTVAGAYYDFIRIEGEPNTVLNSTVENFTAPDFVRHGNSMFDISDSSDPTVNLFALASRFRVVNVAANYGVPVGRYTFEVNADAARNIGFNQQEILARTGLNIVPRINGYVGDLSFGDPSIFEAWRWRLVFGYRYVQRDAVVDALTDADFHEGGTDAQGYYIWASLGLAPNVWTRLRYLSGNEIDPPRYHVDIIQWDLSTRF
jgi:Putative porin